MKPVLIALVTCLLTACAAPPTAEPNVTAIVGATLIDGKRFAWGDHDSFVVPPWAWHEHENNSETEMAYLFSINDLPVLKSFNLNREEALEENEGHQTETSVFDPDNPN